MSAVTASTYGELMTAEKPLPRRNTSLQSEFGHMPFLSLNDVFQKEVTINYRLHLVLS